MNVEDLRSFCLSLKATKENMPWSNPRYSMLVTFSVGSKWFCLLDPYKKSISVKGDPEKIQETLSRYNGAFPAWHMNKTHWLSISLESDVPDSIIQELIVEGYKIVSSHLPKKIKEELDINT